MMRRMEVTGWGSIAALFVLSAITGCMTFKGKSQEVGTETETGADGDTDGDTDSDSDADSDGDTDSDSDADSDSDSDTDSDGDTDSDSDADSDSDSDADSDVDTDADTDVDTDSDTDGDSDTLQDDAGPDGSTDGDADGDSDSDSDADTATDSDTTAPECNEGDTEACEDAETCVGGTCEACTADTYCGSSCVDCTENDGEPYCLGAEASTMFCGCTASSCGEAEFCNVDHACESCISPDGCGGACEPCSDEEPLCVGDDPATARCECDELAEVDTCGGGTHCVAGACEPCLEDTACGGECTDCTTTGTPVCDPTAADGTGACVECLDNNDCRGGDSEPFDSVFGVCSPDKTCTCHSPDAAVECDSSASCPDGFVCASDLSTHFVCLRTCGDTAVPPQAGIQCALKNNAEESQTFVWVPTTTCFAFDKLGDTCSSAGQCSVDGSGGISDGTCAESEDGFLRCTYNCGSNDDACPAESSCVTSYCDTANLIDTDTGADSDTADTDTAN